MTDAVDHPDDYATAAPYLHLLSLPMWATLTARVATVLSTAPAGPVLDLGAGTGLGTSVVLQTLPGRRVVAAEPSPALRGILLARLHDDPDGGCVTVRPESAQSLAPPDALGAVLALNMIGSLDPAERADLFGRLVARMAPGAPLVLTVQPPAEAVEVPRFPPFGVDHGGLTYRGTGSAVPVGPDCVVWTMEYATLEGEDVLDEATASFRWWVTSPARLADELVTAGLVVETDDDLVVGRMP